MNLTIYNNKSDRRVVNKNLEIIAQLNAVQMRDDFDVRNGLLELDTILGRNLYNGEYTNNRYINASGNVTTQNSYWLTAYIPVNGDFCVTYTPSTEPYYYANYALFNFDHAFIERRLYQAGSGIIQGNHTGYIRISCYKDKIPVGTPLMVNNGNIPLPYEDYGTATDLNKANYCHIDDLNRYYYITDVTTDGRTGRWRLNLKCDVLMTFASGIRSLSGTVDRQQNKYNGYIPDGEYKQLAFSQITAKAFPNAMNNDTLILMTVG